MMFREIVQLISDLTGFTIGTKLQYGHLRQNAPVRYVLIQETGGGTTFWPNTDVIDMSIQCLNRAATYDEARADAYAVFTAIHGTSGWNLPRMYGVGEDYIAQTIEALYAPQFLGVDDNKRFIFSTNYIFRMEMGGCGESGYDPELVVNGSFDSDVAGWSVWVPGIGTIASVAGGVGGGNCLAITRLGGGAQSAIQTISGLTVGRIYELSGWIKSGTSGNETGLLAIYESPTWLNGRVAITITAAEWRRLRMTFVASAVDIFVSATKQSATAGTMLFDEISVRLYGT